MNNSEKQVKQQLESEGWRVLRGGAPDFIPLKVDGDGKIIDFKGVEVKSKNGKLSYEQSIYKMIFEMAGIPYEVVVTGISKPDHSSPDHTPPTLPNPNRTSPGQSRPGQSKPNQILLKENNNGKEI